MQNPTALAALAADEGTKAGNLFGDVLVLALIVAIGLWCARKAIRIRDNAGGRLTSALIALIAFGVAAYFGLHLFK